MIRKTIICSLLLCVAASAQTVDEWIARAGNASNDADCLAALKALDAMPNLDRQLKTDLNTLITEISKFMHHPRLEYFSKVTRESNYVDFGLAEDSPLLPIADFYAARMLLWTTLGYGGIWGGESRRERFDAIRTLFEQTRDHFPENRIARMYLGEKLPPEIVYEPNPGAPAWANAQRESLERLSDIIYWWIDHRLQPNGQYGGGWGDDCEMWRFWVPVLIGFDDPKIVAAQQRFSRALLAQPHMKGGYTDHVYDVEHTSEDSSDVMTPMMHLEPDRTEWKDHALRLAELMRTVWMDRNERDQLQFKSIYFSVDTVRDDPRVACDTVYHARAAQPTLLYWQRTRDPELTALFTDWIDTWVDATAREERGKAAGIVPSAIHWPDGAVGGLEQEPWWNPNEPLYRFPSAMTLMLNAILLTHLMTDDAKYLEPIRSMTEIRLRYLESGGERGEPGSESWCASQLRTLSGVAGKYRLATGRDDFDAFLEREANAYTHFRLTEDRSTVDEALDQTAAALRTNFPGYTVEPRYTDRVMRFPSLFDDNQMYKEELPGFAMPDTNLLYATATGDPGIAQICPMNAVRWRTPARDIAALVTESGKTGFAADLFHFGENERVMRAELFLLDFGEYTWELTSGDETLATGAITVERPRTEIPFVLPPGRLCTLRVERAVASG